MKIIKNSTYKFLLVLFLGITSCQKQTKKLVSKKAQPNIIYVYADQLSANMMSCAGNNYLKTPAFGNIIRVVS